MDFLYSAKGTKTEKPRTPNTAWEDLNGKIFRRELKRVVEEIIFKSPKKGDPPPPWPGSPMSG